MMSEDSRDILVLIDLESKNSQLLSLTRRGGPSCLNDDSGLNNCEDVRGLWSLKIVA
jgi:hypothetical protein